MTFSIQILLWLIWIYIFSFSEITCISRIIFSRKENGTFRQYFKMHSLDQAKTILHMHCHIGFKSITWQLHGHFLWRNQSFIKNITIPNFLHQKQKATITRFAQNVLENNIVFFLLPLLGLCLMPQSIKHLLFNFCIQRPQQKK